MQCEIDFEMRKLDLVAKQFKTWCIAVNEIHEPKNPQFEVRITTDFMGKEVRIKNPSKELMKSYARNDYAKIFNHDFSRALHQMKSDDAEHAEEKDEDDDDQGHESAEENESENAKAGSSESQVVFMNNLNQDSEIRDEDVAKFVGSTVGMFANVIGVDTDSAVHTTTIDQDIAGLDLSLGKGISITGVVDVETGVSGIGFGCVGICNILNPQTGVIQSLHCILPGMHKMKKPNKFHADRRIIGQNRLRDKGMPLLQRFWNGRDVVLDERTGMMLICSDHKDILVTETFPVDARKLWNKKDHSGKYVFREVCEKVKKEECSHFVKIQHSPTFTVVPVPDRRDKIHCEYNDKMDFQRARAVQVEGSRGVKLVRQGGVNLN